MALNLLPNEIVYNILSCIAHDRKDLWSYSLVCHNLWDVATAMLYSDIKFDFEFKFRDRKSRIEKNKETKLLNALASNPNLGAKVRTLSISYKYENAHVRDDYLTFGQEQGEQAARNMRYLTKVSLPDTALTHHIIANISSYSELVELNLRLDPVPSQWGSQHKPLKILRWTVPVNWTDENDTPNSWDTAAHVIKIAGAVFPELEELDISNVGRNQSDKAPHHLPEEVNESMQNVVLPRLRTFRYKGGVYQIVQAKDRELMLHFIQRNHALLTSLRMAFGFRFLDQEMMHHLQKFIKAAPKLKSMAAIKPYRRPVGAYPIWHSHKLPVWPASAPSSASPKQGIEFFEMWDIGCSFSAEIGKFFSGFKSLRVLKLGAPLVGDDGRPQFYRAAPGISAFVRYLPQSIEEMYIELHNDRVVCDDDEDFDPIEELVPDIFKAMPRLHTLDLNAWITDIDGGLGYLPEKAVICRRRPSENADNKQKVVWVSRFDCVYQYDYASLKNKPLEVRGNFEGKDADEPWLGGKRTWISSNIKYWVDGVYLKGENEGHPGDETDEEEEEDDDDDDDDEDE